MTDALTVEESKAGAMFTIEVRPGGRRDALAGIIGGALKVEVTAAPEKGKANKAVVALLSKVLGVARSSVRIKPGASSRRKRVVVLGQRTSAVRGMLERAVAGKTRRA